MDYNKVRFVIEPMSDMAADVLDAMLAEVGFETFETVDDGVEAYIQREVMRKEEIDEVVDGFFLPDVSISYTVEEVESQDWNEEWEKAGFEPIMIPGLAVIHDLQHKVDVASDDNASVDYKYDITINPRMAFGSGTHETTSQLTELLLNVDMHDKRVLDMGCGTGILGIAMAMRGASHVCAIDMDEFSVKNTCENFMLNGFAAHSSLNDDADESSATESADVEVIHGNVNAVPVDSMYDVVVANIHRNILLADMQRYVEHMSSGALLYMSGFYTQDADDIVSHAEGLGLYHVQTCTRNDWTVVVMRK